MLPLGRTISVTVFCLFAALAHGMDGGFANRFVKSVSVKSASTEATESLVYGSDEYGYFETSELLRQGQRVSARLVPPGFRSPIDFYLKKRRIDGTFYYEKTSSESFANPLLPSELISHTLPTAVNFTSRFLIGSGSANEKAVAYITNRFGEIVWVYSSTEPGACFFSVDPLGQGKYALIEMSGLFEIFNFDGTVEKSVNFSTWAHHDLLYEGGNQVITFGSAGVDFGGQVGSHLPPDKYSVGTILGLDLSTGKVKTLWNSFATSVLISGRSPVDLDHINSINHVSGKGYLVSLRNFSTLIFLDESFQVLWSLGSAPGATISTAGTNHEFYHQHHATVLANGNILLFDNGRVKSRALELRVDEVEQSVSLVQEFWPDLPLWGEKKGSAYRLSNGNTVALIVSTDTRLHHTVEFNSAGKQTAIMTVPSPDAFRCAYRMRPLDTIGGETYLGSSLPK